MPRFALSSATARQPASSASRDTLRADLPRANAIDTSGLSHSTRTSVEVVRSAYATALEGFALPYGDVAVGGWRNTPYVVIQNVGAYLDVPRFLDCRASDRECGRRRSLSRAARSPIPKQLDSELGRVIAAARARAWFRPTSCSTRRSTSCASRAKGARKGGGLVESIERRTREKNIPGNWAERARAIVADRRSRPRSNGRSPS